MCIKVFILFIVILFISCSVDTGNDDSDERSFFYHYDEIETKFSGLVETNRSIARIETIGYSGESRKIIAVKISDNPNIDESEPAVRLIGNIHGDEKLGAELLLKLADYLTGSYNSDNQIKELVDNLEIWIVPVLNPDGMENRNSAGEFESVRYNSNGVDLNRNFSFNWSSNEIHGSAPFSEAESFVLKEFSERENFTSGLSFHTGALCISYLTDYISENVVIESMGLDYYKENIFPDYEIVKSMAYGYMKTHSNSSFYTTNGGDWYPIDGSIGDWSYFDRGVLDFTIELSNDKYPYFQYDDLDVIMNKIWLENRDSVIDFFKSNLNTLQGVVLDRDSEEPLSAVISITGNKVESYTSNVNGSFGRLLYPGSYDLTFSADGYTSVVKSTTIGNQRNDIGTIYLEKSTSQDRINFNHSVIQPQITDRVRKSEYYNREE